MTAETLTDGERRIIERYDSRITSKALRIIDALAQRVTDLESVDERGLMALCISELEARAGAAERETAALRAEVEQQKVRAASWERGHDYAWEQLAAANALLHELDGVTAAEQRVLDAAEAWHVADINDPDATDEELHQAVAELMRLEAAK